MNARRRGLGDGAGPRRGRASSRHLRSCSPGVLSYLNYVGMWRQPSFSWDRRVSYRRWASRLNSVKQVSRQSDSEAKQVEDQPDSLPLQGILTKPLCAVVSQERTCTWARGGDQASSEAPLPKNGPRPPSEGC